MYGEVTGLIALAAEVAFGLTRIHPFIDGIKRVAVLAVRAFLLVNGFRFEREQVETVTTFERLAAGELAQHGLSDWIKQNASPRR